MSEQIENVLFSCGLITDIQYADWDDQKNFARTKWRRYRNALSCVRKAVSRWKDQKPPIIFIVQLGDIIDGINSRKSTAERNRSEEAFRAVLNEFSSLPQIPLVHNIGNHELYNFSRKELAKSVFNPLNSHVSASYVGEHSYRGTIEHESEVLYFSFSPHPKFCFVFLDAFDISTLGWEKDSQKRKEAYEILRQFNQNKDLNSPDGLFGLERRFVALNGAVGKVQLLWLETILEQARKNDQKAVIFAHVPFHPGTSDPMCLLWNYQDVLDTLWRFSGVVACFCGHTHEGGYCLDEKGIHHRVFEAVVEAPLDSNAFATLHVREDSIFIEGFGIEKSQVLKFVCAD